ncbi:MAG: ABC transporter permease [Hormoscilla sp. SP5CHS1]|nr:ABC transporter permease [Hormoscilla sp. SP12CHS1]MBC6454668.1 ABC transporter permease [Hormoscilla sp. SP5CHS1]
MTKNLINQLGEWNPQLFREVKGRLKSRNGAIALAVSVFSQLLLVFAFVEKLPGRGILRHRYCTGGVEAKSYYVEYQCLMDAFGNPDINWQLWWTDIFIWMSTIGIFTLLIVGTYMLISDLDREERRGTLNFIRLSPQSTQSILTGKLLGVPIWLYVATIGAMPLHLWSGVAAQVPLSLILTFYGVAFASCVFFYSAALLFGLVSSWMGGFQAWLASGMLLFFLTGTTAMRILENPMDLLNLLSPSTLLAYLVPDQFAEDVGIFGYSAETLLSHLHDWRWFHLPIGSNEVTTAGFMVLNYGLWTIWIWQALNRRFRNPNSTTLSKTHSYWLVGGLEVLMVGFAPLYGSHNDFSESLSLLLLGNLWLFASLIAALSPGRQVCIDWARYRHQSGVHRQHFWQDLMWGEKSPAVAAIALNLIEANLILLPWVILYQNSDSKMAAIAYLLLSISMLMLYASIAQLMLLMKTQKPGLWAASTIGAAICLPPFMLAVLSISPGENHLLWMFTAFPWAAFKYASAMTVVVSFVGQLGVAGMLNWQLTRQLRLAGSSASKALIAGRQ